MVMPKLCSSSALVSIDINSEPWSEMTLAGTPIALLKISIAASVMVLARQLGMGQVAKNFE